MLNHPIRDLLFHYSVIFLYYEIQPPLSENRIKLTEARANDENKTTQTKPSKCPPKCLAVQSKKYHSCREKKIPFLFDVNKSFFQQFFSFCPAILLLCAFRPYLLRSKPVKPGHYRAIRAYILRVLLTKYGVKWRNSGIIN